MKRKTANMLFRWNLLWIIILLNKPIEEIFPETIIFIIPVIYCVLYPLIWFLCKKESE